MMRSAFDLRSHLRGANAVSADFDTVERRRSRYTPAGAPPQTSILSLYIPSLLGEGYRLLQAAVYAGSGYFVGVEEDKLL